MLRPPTPFPGQRGEVSLGVGSSASRPGGLSPVSASPAALEQGLWPSPRSLPDSERAVARGACWKGCSGISASCLRALSTAVGGFCRPPRPTPPHGLCGPGRAPPGLVCTSLVHSVTGLSLSLSRAGGPDNQVHFEGYQVSNQCMALVRDECLLPCKDAPELGYAKESSSEQYVPDVFYKVTCDGSESLECGGALRAWACPARCDLRRVLALEPGASPVVWSPARG